LKYKSSKSKSHINSVHNISNHISKITNNNNLNQSVIENTNNESHLNIGLIENNGLNLLNDNGVY